MTDTALVLGEALVDIVPSGSGVAEHPGGSPLNVAVGLGRLGHAVTLGTWIGDDPRGRAILDHLAASGVTVLPGSTGAPRTSSASVAFDAAGTAHYTFDLTWELPPLPAATPLVAHTGSIGAALHPGADSVLAALRALQPTTSISYDPNTRPQIMDRDQVLPLAEAFVALADVVKASDEDLAWLYPGVPPETAARAWLDTGPSLVILTQGPAGVVGLTRTLRIAHPAPSVTVADTVGAGDAFMAGLLHGLWQADLLGANRRTALGQLDSPTLAHLLELASAVAAITLSRPGADPPRLAELTA